MAALQERLFFLDSNWNKIELLFLLLILLLFKVLLINWLTHRFLLDENNLTLKYKGVSVNQFDKGIVLPNKVSRVKTLSGLSKVWVQRQIATLGVQEGQTAYGERNVWSYLFALEKSLK